MKQHYITARCISKRWFLWELVHDGYGFIPKWTQKRAKARVFDNLAAAQYSIQVMGLNGASSVMATPKDGR